MVAKDIQGFSYASLDIETRVIVQQRTTEIHESLEGIKRNFLSIGRKLIEVKARLNHGEFGEWLNMEFKWSHDTAGNLMNAARLAEQNPKFSEFAPQFAPSAFYLLAKPSTPTDIREGALGLAAEGQTITHGEIKAAIQAHKVTSSPVAPMPDDEWDKLADTGENEGTRSRKSTPVDEPAPLDTAPIHVGDEVVYDNGFYTVSGESLSHLTLNKNGVLRVVERTAVFAVIKRGSAAPPQAHELPKNVGTCPLCLATHEDWRKVDGTISMYQCGKCRVASLLKDIEPLSLSHPASYEHFYGNGYAAATCPHCGEIHVAWTPSTGGVWRCERCEKEILDGEMQLYTKADADTAARVKQAQGDARKGAEALINGKPASKTDPLMTSESNEWYTPENIIHRARNVFGGEIDLDPASCALANETVKARRYFDKETNGLEQSWESTALWLNPPYGADVPEWVDTLIMEHKAGRVKRALLLVAARTDTKWFKSLREFPRVMFSGRLKFDAPDGQSNENGATFPSMLVGVGVSPASLQLHFGDLGDVYVLWRLEDQPDDMGDGQ